MEEALKYLSPFLAALLASYLTYLFTMRSRKYEILLKERIPAFKSIQRRIVSLKRYCMARVAEYQGNEFAAHFDDLPGEDKKSALSHRSELGNLVEENLIFLSSQSRKSLEDLDTQLSLLCNLELSLAANPDQSITSSAQGAYEATLDRIDTCLENLYSELKLPA